MERKQATRIQESVLNTLEHKALIWLAARQPRWVTSDMLTAIGTFGAFLIGLGYALTFININFLWLSTFGLLVNWYGDSLDGNLARYRHKQRPVYGYYLDHTMDVINESMMFFGAGMAPFFDMRLTLSAFILYLLMTLNVSMNAHLKSEFKLTYLKLGPTEFRSHRQHSDALLRGTHPRFHCPQLFHWIRRPDAGHHLCHHCHR